MNCGICLKEPDNPVKCSECTFTGCTNCISEWYRLTIQKSSENVVVCGCPQCREKNTFPVTISNTDQDDQDQEANWVDVGIVEGDIISPQQYSILPTDFTNRWVFQPIQMKIDDIEELVGYVVLSRRRAMQTLIENQA